MSVLGGNGMTVRTQGKIKEEVNIYDRPNLLTLRKYILTEELPN